MSDAGIVKSAVMLLLAALGACTSIQQLGNPKQAGAPLASARHRPDRARPAPSPKRPESPSRLSQQTPTASAPTPAVPAAARAAVPTAVSATAPAAVPAAASDGPLQKNQPQASQPDWTRLFKAWENGCANSPELDAFEKHFVFFDKQRGLQVGEVRLPNAFKAATGTPVSRYRVDYSIYILPVTAGSYYGIPVKSIEFYSGNENGIRGKQIVLKASEQEVQKVLGKKNVSFNKVKAYRAIVSGTARETAVTCDYSDSGG